ncbi:MAG: PAS domain S-box protein [Roseiflexaceae bacterium]|nr:PAS domain S-box protein [Roseiflexaceae bacterium]
MAAHRDTSQPSHTTNQALSPAMPDAAEQLHDIQAVNEQLLISSLRERTSAEYLRRQLAFSTAITTSLGEGLYVLDTADRCTFVNPAAERMLGWSDDELRGRNISVVFPMLPVPAQAVPRFGTAQRDENALFVHRNGTLFSTAYSASPFTTSDGIAGAVITFRDMSEVRRLQRMREEYLALISHDLRAPLTAILGRAEILLRRLTQQGLDRDADSARIVIASSLRMNAMIEELLDRSRVGADTEMQQASVIDLVAVAQQMLDQTIAPDARAQITLHAVAALPVSAKEAQIKRVIVNLLTNALKFSARGAPIAVRVYQQGAEAIFAISDQGVGIAPEHLPHLFEKHYRVKTVEQVEGNGLGLYSSRLIVEAHGGRLWAESTLGVGSTFTLALPLSG